MTDLHPAFACAQGEPRALAYLRTRVVPRAVLAVRAVEATAAFREEIEQQLLERVLVPAGGQPPRIADYAGRGPLEHWLRAVALRLALNGRRAQGGGWGWLAPNCRA